MLESPELDALLFPMGSQESRGEGEGYRMKGIFHALQYRHRKMKHTVYSGS